MTTSSLTPPLDWGPAFGWPSAEPTELWSSLPISFASSLRDAQRTVCELESIRQVHLIMNRIQPKLLRKLRATIDDAMNTAGLPLIGVVPEDDQVMLAANLGQPLTAQGRRGAALACWNIALRLDGNQVPIMRIR